MTKEPDALRATQCDDYDFSWNTEADRQPMAEASGDIEIRLAAPVDPLQIWKYVENRVAKKP